MRNLADFQSKDPRKIDTLLEVMAILRDRESGCPWDVEQDFHSIASYTIEEAYEVADAISRNDKTDLREELGDLLFQTVFHAQMAEEEKSFTFADIVETITTKMIRRHPHVFDDNEDRTSDEQTIAWEALKAEERAAKGKTGLLDDIPLGLPGLTRAVKLQKRAARIGFDWPDIDGVLKKIQEESLELSQAIDDRDQDHIEDEFGDLLFALANLSRHLKIDPEKALRRTNEKFTRRFAYVEENYNAQGESTPSLDEMEQWWQKAKQEE